jgi:hypothetical protein
VDITQDITFQYISRLRHHTDELGLVVQGHLLIEYVLNEIIRHRFVRPAAILNVEYRVLLHPQPAVRLT